MGLGILIDLCFLRFFVRGTPAWYYVNKKYKLKVKSSLFTPLFYEVFSTSVHISFQNHLVIYVVKNILFATKTSFFLGCAML